MSGGKASARYDTIVKLASGGMATVWIGTARGALGFRQLVAIKKPHPHLLADAGYRRELVAEARLASLIRHANVVDVRDVEVDGDSISLVMDYIEGASLGELIVAAARRGTVLSTRVAVRIALDALAGLHAAHELIDERGRPVSLVHRDVSPQNILVGVDGLARVADFGVAKFTRKNESDSSEGSLKGKLAYMAPEYLRGEPIDRRFDIFALGIVLWETLTGKRLFRGANEAETLRLLLDHQPESLVTAAPAAAALDYVIATALARPVEQRFQNAQAMATALEATALAAGLCGGHTEVAATLKDLVGPMIEERRTLIRAKQAHEPSIASLMGMEPVSNVPPTVANVSAGTATATVPTTQPLGTATVSPQTNVPSTMPMTPRMEDAPVRTLAMSPGHGAAPVAATALSPALSPAAAPPPVPAPSGATLASATPPADPAAVARAEGMMDTQLSFNDPSARTAFDPVPRPPRSRLAPVIAGVIVALVAAGGITFAATRAKRSTPATAEPSTAVSLAASESAAPAASIPPSAPVVPSSTVSAAASAAPIAAGAHAGRPRSGRPVSGASGAATAGGATAPALPAPGAAVPTPAATPTTKKPPPNPYANDVAQ
jgi:serine/threonine-protein kinase